MNIDFNSDKIIITYFPTYAGGKFLINCLALSRHATFQHAEITSMDLRLKDANEPNYYAWKLEMALNSIPESEDKIKNWRENEIYGCENLFNWASFLPLPTNLSTAIETLSNRNDSNFFIIAHNLASLKNVKTIFPNAKILKIINFFPFIEIAYNRKNIDGNFKKDKNFIKSISMFKKDSTQVKIDYCISYKNIFNEELFLAELKNLYNQLGYDDFNKELVKIFYRKYISLHL